MRSRWHSSLTWLRGLRVVQPSTVSVTGLVRALEVSAIDTRASASSVPGRGRVRSSVRAVTAEAVAALLSKTPDAMLTEPGDDPDQVEEFVDATDAEGAGAAHSHRTAAPSSPLLR